MPPAVAAPRRPAIASQFDRRRWTRWGLFGLLPLALIVGSYWYVIGGRIMSTDDAYVDAEQVRRFDRRSGIVQDVDVTDNQHVAAGKCFIAWIRGNFRSRSTTPRPIWRKPRFRSTR